MTQFKSEYTHHPSISFQADIDGDWAPYHGESGNILLPDEWQEVIAKASGFYSKVTAGWIAQENDRFQSEQCKMYEAAMASSCSQDKPPKTSPGWVYILQAGQYYKIGHSNKPTKRFEQLATLPPWPTEIIHTIQTKDKHRLEKELHSQFAEKRTNGEWFTLSDEDLEWLKGL